MDNCDEDKLSLVQSCSNPNLALIFSRLWNPKEPSLVLLNPHLADPLPFRLRSSSTPLLPPLNLWRSTIWLLHISCLSVIRVTFQQSRLTPCLKGRRLPSEAQPNEEKPHLHVGCNAHTNGEEFSLMYSLFIRAQRASVNFIEYAGADELERKREWKSI